MNAPTRNGRADRRETACRRQPRSGERSEANASPRRPSIEVGGLGDPALPNVVSIDFLPCQDVWSSPDVK